jgi:hypothetical protein
MTIFVALFVVEGIVDCVDCVDSWIGLGLTEIAGEEVRILLRHTNYDTNNDCTRYVLTYLHTN